MLHLEALLEVDALGLALERGVEDLDALLGQILGRQVATACRLGAWLRTGGRRRRRVTRRVARQRRRRRVVDLLGERVELRLGLGELHLQLRHVDALGLCNEDAPSQKLQVLLELLVRPAQLVALGGHLRQRRPRARESGLELRDTRDELLLIEERAREHGAACNHATDPCRGSSRSFRRASVHSGTPRSASSAGSPPPRFRRAALRASRRRPPRGARPRSSPQGVERRRGLASCRKCTCRCRRRTKSSARLAAVRRRQKANRSEPRSRSAPSRSPRVGRRKSAYLPRRAPRTPGRPGDHRSLPSALITC